MDRFAIVFKLTIAGNSYANQGVENKKLLIIDGLNMFLRNYIVNPALAPNGHPIGGCMAS